jgi:hypothetical protein
LHRVDLVERNECALHEVAIAVLRRVLVLELADIVRRVHADLHHLAVELGARSRIAAEQQAEIELRVQLIGVPLR